MGQEQDMKHAPAAAPVVVGVDGSRGAVAAAEWAIDEAIARNVRLRIVHVIDVAEEDDEPTAPYDAFRLDIEYAETALRGAAAAVNAVGSPVTTETDILWGPVDSCLVKESANASMICLGSVGGAAKRPRLLGSTGTAVAENAHCPVAVVRTAHRRPVAETRWIITVVEDDPDTDTVLHYTMLEARTRRAPVLAVGVRSGRLGDVPDVQIDLRVAAWRDRFPDVRIRHVAGADMARCLAEITDNSVQLAVVCEHDADQLATIVGPNPSVLAPQAVLIVR